VFVSRRKLSRAFLVTYQQVGGPGDDPDSGYRQIAHHPPYGPKTTGLVRPGREQ
jgi:hypothetical protein